MYILNAFKPVYIPKDGFGPLKHKSTK